MTTTASRIEQVVDSFLLGTAAPEDVHIKPNQNEKQLRRLRNSLRKGAGQSTRSAHAARRHPAFAQVINEVQHKYGHLRHSRRYFADLYEVAARYVGHAQQHLEFTHFVGAGSNGVVLGCVEARDGQQKAVKLSKVEPGEYETVSFHEIVREGVILQLARKVQVPLVQEHVAGSSSMLSDHRRAGVAHVMPLELGDLGEFMKVLCSYRTALEVAHAALQGTNARAATTEEVSKINRLQLLPAARVEQVLPQGQIALPQGSIVSVREMSSPSVLQDKTTHVQTLRFAVDAIAAYARQQQLWAVDIAHRLGMVLRDIKVSNFLVDPYLTVKVADFGSAFRLPPELQPWQQDPDFTRNVGMTPPYRAVEDVVTGNHHLQASDADAAGKSYLYSLIEYSGGFEELFTPAASSQNASALMENLSEDGRLLVEALLQAQPPVVRHCFKQGCNTSALTMMTAVLSEVAEFSANPAQKWHRWKQQMEPAAVEPGIDNSDAASTDENDVELFDQEEDFFLEDTNMSYGAFDSDDSEDQLYDGISLDIPDQLAPDVALDAPLVPPLALQLCKRHDHFFRFVRVLHKILSKSECQHDDEAVEWRAAWKALCIVNQILLIDEEEESKTKLFSRLLSQKLLIPSFHKVFGLESEVAWQKIGTSLRALAGSGMVVLAVRCGMTDVEMQTVKGLLLYNERQRMRVGDAAGILVEQLLATPAMLARFRDKVKGYRNQRMMDLSMQLEQALTNMRESELAGMLEHSLVRGGASPQGLLPVAEDAEAEHMEEGDAEEEVAKEEAEQGQVVEQDLGKLEGLEMEDLFVPAAEASPGAGVAAKLHILPKRRLMPVEDTTHEQNKRTCLVDFGSLHVSTGSVDAEAGSRPQHSNVNQPLPVQEPGLSQLGHLNPGLELPLMQRTTGNWAQSAQATQLPLLGALDPGLQLPQWPPKQPKPQPQTSSVSTGFQDHDQLNPGLHLPQASMCPPQQSTLLQRQPVQAAGPAQLGPLSAGLQLPQPPAQQVDSQQLPPLLLAGYAQAGPLNPGLHLRQVPPPTVMLQAQPSQLSPSLQLPQALLQQAHTSQPLAAQSTALTQLGRLSPGLHLSQVPTEQSTVKEPQPVQITGLFHGSGQSHPSVPRYMQPTATTLSRQRLPAVACSQPAAKPVPATAYQAVAKQPTNTSQLERRKVRPKKLAEPAAAVDVEDQATSKKKNAQGTAYRTSGHTVSAATASLKLLSKQPVAEDTDDQAAGTVATERPSTKASSEVLTTGSLSVMRPLRGYAKAAEIARQREQLTNTVRSVIQHPCPGGRVERNQLAQVTEELFPPVQNNNRWKNGYTGAATKHAANPTHKLTTKTTPPATTNATNQGGSKARPSPTWR